MEVGYVGRRTVGGWELLAVGNVGGRELLEVGNVGGRELLEVGNVGRRTVGGRKCWR